MSVASNGSCQRVRRRVAGPHVHQLGRDPHPARAARGLLPAYRGGEQVVGPQLARDLLWRLRRVPVLVGAAAGDHLEAGDLGQLAAHFVGDPVREVGVGRVAQVLERQHREPPWARRPRRAAGASSARRTARPGPAEAESEGEGGDGDPPLSAGHAERRGRGRDRGGARRQGRRRIGRPGDDGAPWCYLRGAPGANSAVVANRSAGTDASARWIDWSIASGTLGRTRRTLGTGSMNRFAMTTCAVGPVYGGSPGEHLVEHGAERVDVGPGVDRLVAAGLLGAHVGRRARRPGRSG